MRLFAGPYGRTGPLRNYDMGRYGRFLLSRNDPNARSKVREVMAPTRIELVANWFEELRARVPTE